MASASGMTSGRAGLRRAVDWLRPLLSNRIGVLGAAIIVSVTLLAVFAAWIAPHDPLQVDLAQKLMPPSREHLMGTDQAGRDVLSRVLWGARPSLEVGLLAVVIGLLGGVTLGTLAGFYSDSLLDHAIMRAVDVLASIPLLVWAIAIVGIVGVGPLQLGPFAFPNEIKLTMLIGFLYVPAIARITYSVVLGESKLDYVRARRLQGTSDAEIMVREILRNCLSPLIVQASLSIAVGVILEASLSFVGLGVQPPKPSWGTMLADARSYVFSGEWWLPVFPGLAIAVTVIGFNLCGDALRNVLDPRKKTTQLMI